MDKMDKEEVVENNNQQEPVKQTVGEWLKQHRLAENLSIFQMSQMTKIHVNTLTAIEESQFHHLPQYVYIRGFIQSYAKTLKLSTSEAEDLLKSTYANRSKAQQNLRKPKSLDIQQDDPSLFVPQEDQIDSEKTMKNKFLPRANTPSGMTNRRYIQNIALFLGFIIFLLSLLWIWQTSDRQTSTKTSTKSLQQVVHSQQDNKNTTEIKNIEEIKEVSKEEKKIEAPLETLDAEALKTIVPPEKTESSEISNQSINISIPKTEEKKSPPPSNQAGDLKITVAENLPASITLENIQTPTIEYGQLTAQDKTYLPEESEIPLSQGEETVYLKAFAGDCWVTYKKDDEDIKKFILTEGQFVLIRGKHIRLFVGNIHALKVFHNNRPIIAKTRSGVKSLVFPQSLEKKIKTPLFYFSDDGSAHTTMNIE